MLVGSSQSSYYLTECRNLLQSDPEIERETNLTLAIEEKNQYTEEKGGILCGFCIKSGSSVGLYSNILFVSTFLHYKIRHSKSS